MCARLSSCLLSAAGELRYVRASLCARHRRRLLFRLASPLTAGGQGGNARAVEGAPIVSPPGGKHITPPLRPVRVLTQLVVPPPVPGRSSCARGRSGTGYAVLLPGACPAVSGRFLAALVVPPLRPGPRPRPRLPARALSPCGAWCLFSRVSALLSCPCLLSCRGLAPSASFALLSHHFSVYCPCIDCVLFI